MNRVSMVLMVTLTAAMSAQAPAMEVDEIIAKNIEAIGGLEKIKSVNTLQMFGKSHVQSLEFPFTMTQMRPNRLRVETTIQGQTVIQALDGEKGWYINPMSGSTEPQEMPEEAIKQMKLEADIDGFLVDYQDKGYKVEFKGEEDVEGTPAYQLTVTDTADLHVDIYLDVEYFLDIKWTIKGESEGNTYEVDLYFSDYKEVNGMVEPHAMETKMGGQLVSQITIDSMSFNPEIDSTMFNMPAKEEKAKEEEKPKETDKE